MENPEVQKERRRDKRYRVKDGTYAVLGAPANKLGQIVDISMSGMAFTYLADNDPIGTAEALDILANQGICVEKIPYTTVTDVVVPNETPFSTIIMRRHCIKFNELTTETKTKIQELIGVYGYHQA